MATIDTKNYLQQRAMRGSREKLLASQYEAVPVTVTEPAILIRINQLYRSGMNATELYEVTRGVWKVGVRRKQAHYALAVFQGVVKAVYRINTWHEAATTCYQTRQREDVNVPGRSEFVGEPAEAQLCEKYIGKSVSGHFATNSQNPITYVNC
jgi:uncharacterized protein